MIRGLTAGGRFTAVDTGDKRPNPSAPRMSSAHTSVSSEKAAKYTTLLALIRAKQVYLSRR